MLALCLFAIAIAIRWGAHPEPCPLYATEPLHGRRVRVALARSVQVAQLYRPDGIVNTIPIGALLWVAVDGDEAPTAGPVSEPSMGCAPPLGQLAGYVFGEERWCELLY